MGLDDDSAYSAISSSANMPTTPLAAFSGSVAGVDSIVPMGFNWEQVLGTAGAELGNVYDESASDALYHDHPRAAPPGGLADEGDGEVKLPFHEE